MGDGGHGAAAAPQASVSEGGLGVANVRVTEDLARRLRALAASGLRPHELGLSGPGARLCVTHLVEQLLRNGLPALERRADRVRAKREADKNQFRLHVFRGRLVAAPPNDDS